MKALETATLIGVSPLEFWQLTPFEFNLMVRAYASKLEDERKEKITLTYMNAQWTAQWMGGKQKPPSLQKLLNTNEKKKAMTDEQMLNKVRQLNAALGGEVRIDGE